MHRDLKSPNVLLSEEGVAKIADVGMVRSQVKDLVTAQPVMTPLWAAPEVVRHERASIKVGLQRAVGAVAVFSDSGLSGRPVSWSSGSKMQAALSSSPYTPPPNTHPHTPPPHIPPSPTPTPPHTHRNTG